MPFLAWSRFIYALFLLINTLQPFLLPGPHCVIWPLSRLSYPAFTTFTFICAYKRAFDLFITFLPRSPGLDSAPLSLRLLYPPILLLMNILILLTPLFLYYSSALCVWPSPAPASSQARIPRSFNFPTRTFSQGHRGEYLSF